MQLVGEDPLSFQNFLNILLFVALQCICIGDREVQPNEHVVLVFFFATSDHYVSR